MLRIWQSVALALQIFQLLFLLLHDWIPLGGLNDVAAVSRMYSPIQRLLGVLLPGVPAGVGVALSLRDFGAPYPAFLRIWLWATYGILFAGELEAWWFPYFFGTSAARVARYQALFSRTHSFLPPRNGIVPNTLHVLLHLATVATLLVLPQLGP